MTDCTPYACVSAACNTGCTLSTDCATGYACVAEPGRRSRNLRPGGVIVCA